MITGKKLESHLEASALIHMIKDETFDFIHDRLEIGDDISELDVQEFMLNRMHAEGLTSDGMKPIVAITKNAAEPHHEAKHDLLTRGELILIDIWARKDTSTEEIYADITWMGYAGNKEELPKEYSNLFELLVNARKAALNTLQKKGVRAWEVDKATRAVIQEAGHGQAFLHRTGHPIDTAVHGKGYTIDSCIQKKDEHVFGTGDLFSIEPGIYYPGKIGLRSEIDVLLHFVPGEESKLVVTGPEQKEIHCLF